MSGLTAVALLGATLIAFVMMLVGLAMMLFRPGRRKRGLTIFLATPVIWVWVMVAMVSWSSTQAGFDGFMDQNEARSAGIDDPVEWAAIRAERDAEEERIAAEAAAAAAAEERRKGFHCLSGRDGAHPAFKRIVKNSMREPDSFEHVKTGVGPVTDGWHTIRMVYRARNGFGGMNVGEAVGRYRNDDCSVEVLSLE
ncbi:hypothetical protein [Rhodovulum sulfidophilum]|uniref:Uncharacterized protein n=1 Tax=Rhodovulum sulfidophilum TaxID=35806 RepID=A0ABS1RSE7_RHOSU|nr:hypothetical protein [Rhodovulum sulfidophilum]MBL3608995.1 hypothetical protein [Rhodovulum sulfidophilum]MCE8458787.1 hypothetical protein [Rhodovulum sulfidophilum]